MLIDIVDQYDSEKKQYLKELRTKIILQLSTQQDHKKIVAFLSKAWIINIEDSEKKVYIGFSNDFMLSNAKKNFNKSLKDAIQTVYNPQYNIEYIVYPPFSTSSDLLIDLWDLLNIKATEKKIPDPIWESLKDKLYNYFGILLDPSFRFDNFIAWSNNQFAFSAAKAVAETPWTAYNPLFIYGNVGLGKTHLMQAIWNEINSNYPDKVIIYLPATKLIDEIILAIQKKNLSSLMRKFDDVDALLIDDIQFLAWKDKTQEIFHNIFNDFHSKKKQIIFSSDRPPRELTEIEPRLKTRFAIWLVADIKAPDYETRIAILQSKLEIKQESIDSELLWIIAQNITSNVRELEWALNFLLTRKAFSWNEITENDVYACLETLGYNPTKPMEWNTNNLNSKSQRNFDTIVEMVANYYSISVAELKSDSRKKEITTARQILMLIAKKHFRRTQQKIWMYFWWKNHATVIYAIWNIEKKLKSDEDIQQDYQIFTERVNQ